MTERKWTKGEWKSYQYEGVTHWPGIEAGSTSIVVWGREWENEGVQGESLDEANANANLIAAAPDLYEALEALVLNLEEGDFISTTRIDAAIAALAKARGETQ